MFNFGKKEMPQPQRRQVSGEGCEVKVKRDEQGNMISFKDNGHCTPQEIKAILDSGKFSVENYEED